MNRTGTALVLLVNREEWAARSFESVLKPNGYAVLKAYTGQQALAVAARIRPDLIMTDVRLPDMMGVEMCDRMLALPTVRASTPMVAFTTGSLGRRERLEQLRGGMWDVFSPPFDPEEMLTRIERFLAAKRDVDTVVRESHVDPLTGLYNLQGVMRRVAELAADAVRSGRDLACVVMGPTSLQPGAKELQETIPAEFALDDDEASGMNGEPEGYPGVVRNLARMMAATTRLSDAIGRIGEAEFVIVAPGIDARGATRLAERVLEILENEREKDEGLGVVGLRAGVYAVPKAEPDSRATPEDVLEYARHALRKAQLEGNGLRIHTFETESISERP